MSRRPGADAIVRTGIPNQKTLIIDELKSGAATTFEISAATGLPRKHSCAILISLHQAGIVSRSPFQLPGERSKFLWQLVDRPQLPKARSQTAI